MLTDQQVQAYIKAIILPQLDQLKGQQAAQNAALSRLQATLDNLTVQVTSINSTQTNGGSLDTYLVSGGIVHKLNTLFQAAVTFAASVVLSSLTASRPLKLNGSRVIISDKIDLAATNDVTGVLPIANGGTNANTAAGARTSLGVPASGVFAGASFRTPVADSNIGAAPGAYTLTGTYATDLSNLQSVIDWLKHFTTVPLQTINTDGQTTGLS